MDERINNLSQERAYEISFQVTLVAYLPSMRS